MDVSRRSSNPLLRIGIIVLTLGTALTHLLLNFPDLIFILNGLGYLALLAALVAPLPVLEPYRRDIRWLLIGYTLLTIVLWVLFGSRTPIGFINKLNEVALVALLIISGRRT